MSRTKADDQPQSVPERAIACLKRAIDADGGNRAAAIDDLNFSAGDQWPDEIKMQRQIDRRPCLTINKTDTFVRSVVNNMRQHRRNSRCAFRTNYWSAFRKLYFL